ncbi:efflux RND transporter periplasmic adaptor subunit [Piscinibacter sp. XHJ-5]|uniref:efflux RND transporter periplasmic adaptor subunit n=1 Tax=Piscinibacter sp. XHJ-5 TaxID=3037797 RepID=UPI002452A438|nr:efflux RND transporter periplasmic adaptor subunit [Piscinibacter sp. XHJ-5]
MNNKILGAAAVLALLLTGCGKSDAPTAASPASSASAAGAPVSVSTVRAEQRDVEVALDATGTVTSLNSVEIRPQVAAVVDKVHVREGQFVRVGEPLFTLDARAMQTDVAKAQAQLQRDLASLADAERNLARSKELVAQNFVSQVAVDTNQTLVDAQRAAVAADRAAVEAARVSLSYSRIVAPYAGRAGLVPVAPGSFVSPSTATPLVTITQLDPIAVAFSLPQRNLSDALQTLRSGGGRVTVVLPEGRGSMQGRLHFVDNVVDASSGAVKVKAVFDNPEEKLWPGAFVGVKLAVQTLKGAIVVPQAAIVQGARGKVVFVVDANDKVQSKPVEVVQAVGQDAVVTGVQAGERIIVDGRQNVRPGVAVVERAAGGASGPGQGRRSGASTPGSGASP